MSNSQDWIEIKGAREHNLKNISVRLPKNKITVVTGLSGSGKSSLVFETLFLESQRRFLDGLSNYTKNFIDGFKRPELDSLKGLSPAISVDQKTASSSPRSTVGTVTEVLDYLRLLYARLGTPYCPHHNVPVRGSSFDEILDWSQKFLVGKKVRVLCPVVQSEKGEFTKEILKWESLGFLKAFVDGELTYLNEVPKLHKRKDHTIDLVVDQFKYTDQIKDRLKKAMLKSFETFESMIAFEVEGEKKLFSIHAACPECGFSYPSLEPRHFSFNSKQGACPDCNGLGTQDIVEYEQSEKVGGGGVYLDIKKKVYDWDEEADFKDCPSCGGSRLNERARSVFYKDQNIADLSRLSIKKLKVFFDEIKLEPKEEKIAKPILEEIKNRLFYLSEVGTDYLSLDRSSESLSGGERQRLRLASQLGSPLVGVLYVLDEPSIGLHSQDHANLLKVVQRLKNQGNTIVIVEHDEDTMKQADYIVEVGPGAGVLGGEVVAQMDYQKFLKQNSLTSLYLRAEKKVSREKRSTPDFEKSFSILNARENNLKNLNVKLPSQCLIGVSGVSGSGKSSLIMDSLAYYGYEGVLCDFEGLDRFKSITTVDQKPIGKTPRSVPATYVGLYQPIRDLFASLPESQVRGFKKGHFSFNSDLGRCGECKGHGQKKLDSHFLSSVSVSCSACNGKRFKPEVLTVQFKGKSISDVLEMSIGEAFEFFKNQKSIHRKLKTLMDVGLTYLKIGQDSTTLSGGEAQRLKLSKELSKSFRGEVLYILDEPTTGLHFKDVQNLLELLSTLVEKGHTVVVIEHQLDLLANCDYILDLGPKGGEDGGEIVDQGSPQDLAQRSLGATGSFLKSYFDSHNEI